MAEQKFDEGAVVRLKSGGPKMTVVDFGQYGYGASESYKCRWFDEKNKLVEGTFTEAELEIYEAKPTSNAWVNSIKLIRNSLTLVILRLFKDASFSHFERFDDPLTPEPRFA